MMAAGARLGMLACLWMAGASGASAIPGGQQAICYGGRETPKNAPNRPMACHATMCRAEHRKLRTFP